MIENETITTRATIAEAMASMLAFQQEHKLGGLDGFNVRDDNNSISLTVKSAEDLAAWADALECSPYARHVSRYVDHAPIHSAWTDRLGWHVGITYYEPELVKVAPLPTEAIVGEVTSPFGPCSGLTPDLRNNTCTNFAAEYVSFPSAVPPATEYRRLCASCADAAPDRISRRPLTTAPGGYPVERAS